MKIVPPDNPQKRVEGSPPRLVYLTTEYPHISHTFIRRELHGLEALGYDIQRVAMKGGESQVEGDDAREAEITLQILTQPLYRQASQVLHGVLLAGSRLFGALFHMLSLNRASDRSLLRHFAYLFEALMLRSIAQRNNTDHIHVHFGTNPATVAYLTHLLGGPGFSVTVHGPVEFDQPYGQSLGEKLAAAKFVAAITNFCQSQVYRWLPMHCWSDVHIVPCSVGDEWFDAGRSIDQSCSGLVSVGRLDEQKGQLLLVDAFANARKRGFSGKLVIVGDGPLRGAIEQRIYANGIEDSVELVGWRTAEEIRTYLLAAKALVLPSFAEGLPVVIMEAMALKRPVLTSRITGIPELVREGIDGYLFAPADTVALTEAMLELDENDVEELSAMGENARQRVRSRHHTDDAVQRLDKLFRSYSP